MSILIAFKGDAGPLLKEIKGVKKSLGNLGKDLRAGVNDFAKWGAAASAAAAAAGLALVQHSAASAKELKNLASLAGTSTTTLQAMAAGANQVGISQEKLADILKDVNDKVHDFLQSGGGPMADFFENIAPKVGVTANQFKKLSGPQALQLYVQSLEAANLSQEQMTFYMEAIASDSTALIPLLKGNAAGFKAAAEQADKLGLIMSEFDVERLVEVDKKFGIIARQAELAKNQIALGLEPVVTALANQFINVSNEAGGVEEVTIRMVNAVAKGVGFAADAVVGLQVAWKAIEVAALAASFVAVNTFATAVKGAAKFLDFALTIPRAIAEQFSKISGVDIRIPEVAKTRFVTDVDDMAMAAALALGEATTAFDTFVQGLELPGEQIEKFVADAFAAGQAAKEAFHAAQAADADQSGDAPLIPGVPTEEERDQALQDEKNFQDALAAIRKGGVDWEKALMGQQFDWQTKETAKTGREILSITAGHSKKAFELNKKVGIAEALISTFQGIAAGLKLGWPMAVPAVAYAAATGFAQVKKLQGMQYGGGGGGGGASAGAGAGAAATAAASSGGGGGGESRPTQVANISIHGDNFGRQGLIALAEQMSELAADGVTVFNIQ